MRLTDTNSKFGLSAACKSEFASIIQIIGDRHIKPLGARRARTGVVCAHSSRSRRDRQRRRSRRDRQRRRRRFFFMTGLELFKAGSRGRVVNDIAFVVSISTQFDESGKLRNEKHKHQQYC